MPAFKDKTGLRFGRLVVVSLERMERGAIWRCRCDCGNETIVRNENIGRSTISCGCAHREELIARNTTHGHNNRGHRTSIHARWGDIIARCTNPNHPAWKYYGGRGIKVCERWHIFENFLADVGELPGPGLTIDREDNSGNYEPGNIRWITMKEQAANRRARGSC